MSAERVTETPEKAPVEPFRNALRARGIRRPDPPPPTLESSRRRARPDRRRDGRVEGPRPSCARGFSEFPSACRKRESGVAGLCQHGSCAAAARGARRFRAGFEGAESPDKVYVKGMELIYQRFSDALKKSGLGAGGGRGQAVRSSLAPRRRNGANQRRARTIPCSKSFSAGYNLLAKPCGPPWSRWR